MADAITVGKIVLLKSGGPLMTVEQVGETTTGIMSAWCTWFDSKNNKQTETFALEALQIYKGEKGSDSDDSGTWETR